MPLCSGLSALIQAATSQLGHLVDNDAADSDASALSLQSPRGDGYASSNDGDMRSSTPTQTPTMVPEDGRRVTFPEKLMTLLLKPENRDIITFLPDGKYFAIRTKEFSNDLMKKNFNVETFEEFLELILAWGFTRISGTEASDLPIQIFRHPYFKRGVVVDRQRVRCGKADRERRLSLPGRTKIEYTTSEESSSSIKRRLSPSHVERDPDDYQKTQCVEGAATGGNPARRRSSTASMKNDSAPRRQHQRRRSSMETRSYALAVTTAQLNIHCSDEEEDLGAELTPAVAAVRRASIGASNKPSPDQMPLIDGAVEKATHTIVTDAIETLLFDETHTRQTYLKHEKELSKSHLPGVVALSKQLFSPPQDAALLQLQSSAQQTVAAIAGGVARATAGAMSTRSDAWNKNSAATTSPTQLEAAAALMKQAGGHGTAGLSNLAAPPNMHNQNKPNF